MINKLYESIGSALKQIKSCVVYKEDVPQGFVLPCFMVTFYEQNPGRGLNGRFKNSVMVDILYFPEDEVNYQEESWDIGQKLSREFCPEGFKSKNRNLKITDKVLHFTFDVDYWEYRKEHSERMQTLSENMSIKEV